MTNESNRITIGVVQKYAKEQLDDLVIFFDKCIQQMMEEFKIADTDTLITKEMLVRLIQIVKDGKKPTVLFDSLCIPFVHFLEDWQKHLSA